MSLCRAIERRRRRASRFETARSSSRLLHREVVRRDGGRGLSRAGARGSGDQLRAGVRGGRQHVEHGAHVHHAEAPLGRPRAGRPPAAPRRCASRRCRPPPRRRRPAPRARPRRARACPPHAPSSANDLPARIVTAYGRGAGEGKGGAKEAARRERGRRRGGPFSARRPTGRPPCPASTTGAPCRSRGRCPPAETCARTSCRSRRRNPSGHPACTCPRRCPKSSSGSR